jgi:hypothetical protein
MMTEFHTARFIRRQTALLFLLLISVMACSARENSKPRRHVSRPEKVWSVLHPLKAKKVLTCARRSIVVTDSLLKAGTLTDRNGGQLDAFRHAYWMALMINAGMSEGVVRKVGERHEKGNYLDFKKGKLEDSARADSMMSVMDLRNNEAGIAAGKKYRGDKKIPLIEMLLNEIWNGNMAIMSKNENGEYLDAQRNVIDLKQYAGKWYIPKHIVKSDMIDVQH